MAAIHVDDREVRIQLSLLEKVFALRGDLVVPREAVTGVTRHDDALAAVRGIRAPGLGIPGRVKIGTWRRRGGKELVVARRGEPALRLELRDQPYTAVVVGGTQVDAALAALG